MDEAFAGDHDQAAAGSDQGKEGIQARHLEGGGEQRHRRERRQENRHHPTRGREDTMPPVAFGQPRSQQTARTDADHLGGDQVAGVFLRKMELLQAQGVDQQELQRPKAPDEDIGPYDGSQKPIMEDLSQLIFIAVMEIAGY